MAKRKDIHFRIEENLLERFEAKTPLRRLKEDRCINTCDSAILHEGGIRKNE